MGGGGVAPKGAQLYSFPALAAQEWLSRSPLRGALPQAIEFWMLDGKLGNLGAKKAQKHGFDWHQGYGGGALVNAPKEKWGEMRENGEKWGGIGGNGLSHH